MDATASARVPVEVKRQGDRKLKEIGSSATELINAAYAYVIEHGELPKARVAASAVEPQVKTLSGDAARRFSEEWSERAKLGAKGYDGNNFKEMLNKARGDYYARFA